MAYRNSKKPVSFSLVFSLCTCLATVSAAQSDVTQKLLDAAAEDPNVARLITQLERGQSDQVVQSTIQMFYQIAPDGVLSTEALELAERRTIAKARARFLSQHLIYDLDGDGAISTVEMAGVFGSDASRLASLRALADTDIDGAVSAEELRVTATEQAENQRGRQQFGYLMAFDLDGDGTVVVDELIAALQELTSNDRARARTQGVGNVSNETFAETQDAPEPPAPLPINPEGLPTELHMVGIYEPRVSRNGDGVARREPVAVKVDRPGVSVTLVLGSYEPTQWVIETSEGTRVDHIVAHDRNRIRGEIVLNGERASVTFRDLPLAYRSDGNRLQPFHAAAANASGIPKAGSFHGSYRAPEDGFVIDDAPGVPTQAEVDAALAAGALRLADLSPKLRDALQGKIKAPGTAWSLRDEGFVGVDDKGKSVVHTLPLEAPEVSWPMGTAYDPKSQRIWGVTLGGVGYLYTYDIANDRWTARSMESVDAGGLIFDPASGNLIATPGPHGRTGYLIMDTTGKVLSRLEIATKDYPGLIGTFDPGNGPSPRMVPIMIDGDLLLVRAEQRMRPNQNSAPRWVYVVDLQSGKARLVR